jgi:hypothetical protein
MSKKKEREMTESNETKFSTPQVGLFYMTEHGKTILFTNYDFDNDKFSYMDPTNGAMGDIDGASAESSIATGTLVLIRQKDMTDILLKVAKKILKAPLSKLHCTIEAADILGLPMPVELVGATKKMIESRTL